MCSFPVNHSLTVVARIGAVRGVSDHGMAPNHPVSDPVVLYLFGKPRRNSVSRFAAVTRWHSLPNGQARFGGRGINGPGHYADPVGRKTPARGVLTDRSFVRRNVDTVELIAGHITLHPLHIRPHRSEEHTSELQSPMYVV